MAEARNTRTFPAAKRTRAMKTVRVSDQVKALLDSVPDSRAAQLKGALIRQRFAAAIIEEYGLAAAAYILEHIQGVYLVKENAPQKANSKGRAPVYLNVYTTEALIKADLDARQEGLKRRLREHEIYFDLLKPYSSTWDMRQRTPFEETVADLRARLETPAAEAAEAASSVSASSGWTEAQIDEAVAQVTDRVLAGRIKQAMAASLGVEITAAPHAVPEAPHAVHEAPEVPEAPGTEPDAESDTQPEPSDAEPDAEPDTEPEVSDVGPVKPEA